MILNNETNKRILADINECINWKQNPRKITEQSLESLISNIEKDPNFMLVNCPFGFVDPDSGKITILGGNQRLKACKKLGWKKFPVIICDDLIKGGVLDLELAKKRCIVDNLNFGEYDLELLKLNFDPEELKEFIGLDSELDNFLNNDSETREIDEDTVDEVPELTKQTDIILGDIFEFKIGLNFYRFGCGDCRDLDFIQKVTQGNELDLLHTDPPYNVAVRNSQGMTIDNDDMSKAEFKLFMRDVYATAFAILKKGAVAYIFHGESERSTFTDEFVSSGFKFAQNLIWVKSSSTMSRQDYNWRHEPILYGWKEGSGHYFNQDFTQTTVIDEDRLDLNKMQKQELINLVQNWKQNSNETVIYEDKTLRNDIHPTMKPVRLCSKLIINSSRVNETVGDLFLGSGSTIIACIQTKRNCVGLELDPIYMQAIVDRTKQFLEKNNIEYEFTKH